MSNDVIELEGVYDHMGKPVIKRLSNSYYFDIDENGQLTCYFPNDMTLSECVKRTADTIAHIKKSNS